MTEKDIVFSDDDVVRSMREGNTRNFEILVDRYKRKIINFIHKMIFDYDEAQSLAQDVFLKVYESMKKYKSPDNFQAFIFTIAKNKTLNYIKKQKRVLLFSGFLSGEHYLSIPLSLLIKTINRKYSTNELEPHDYCIEIFYHWTAKIYKWEIYYPA